MPRRSQSDTLREEAERAAAEEKLRESEARFRQVVEQSPDGIFLANAEGRYLEVNPAGCELLQMTREEVLARVFTDILAPEEHHRLPDEIARFDGGSTVRSEWRMRRKDRSTFAAELVGRRLPNGNLQGVVRDVTARQQAEESIRIQNQQLYTLARTSEQLLFADELDAVKLQRLFTEASEAVGAELFFNFLVGKEPGTLQLTASGGLTQAQRDYFATIRFGEFLCGTVAERREQRVVENLHQCKYAEATALRGEGVKCYAGFPLIARDRLLGTVAFATRTRERFREGDLQLLQSVCDQVAAALERTRLTNEMRASEERFRAMADNIPQLAWMADGEGWIFWYNQGWFEYTGTSLEEMQGWGWKSVHHPKHVDRVVAKVAHHFREGLDWEDTFPLRGKDGEYRWFLSRMKAIHDDSGKVVRFFGTNTDITERRQAEETQRLLTSELSHRVKNMLATVQAIATQTLRHNKNPDAFVANFSGRIQAMSRVHALLSNSKWQGADLRDIIRDQLMQSAVDETRITAWGPNVRIEPEIAPQVAMMLHELGTNSIKYGALSKSDGVVTISWVVNNDAICLRWSERGGPPVSAPIKRGFGVTLIEQSAKGAGGDTRMSIEAEGMQWDLTLPLPRAHVFDESEPSADDVLYVKPASPRDDAVDGDAFSSILKGKRILVVEDEPLVALDIVATLEKAGVEIAGSVGSPAEALALIESARLDGALLDANLGGRPVDDIANALTRKNVPFAFVTGYGRDGLPPAFAAAPILSKPFSQEQLLATATNLMRHGGNVVKLKK